MSEETEREALTSVGGRPAVTMPERFAVEVRRDDDVVVVRPRGELDLATVGTLRACLHEMQIPGRVVLDLRELSFIDTTGLHLLIALNARARRDGFQLTLHAPPAPVDRAIRVSGLDEALPFAPNGALRDAS